jgi:hypothetical protein
LTIFKNGIPITSLSEWQKYAGPKNQNHWVDDRSAKETARAWLEGGGVNLPAEVLSALTNHRAFGAVREWRGEPEAKLKFDEFAGEPRNADLVIHAQDSHGPYLIAIEAKADEPFGSTVEDTYAAAVKRLQKNARSNGVERIKLLVMALFGTDRFNVPPLNGIRYQLLTACAGALCESERRGYNRVLMLVHEFVTDKTSDKNHLHNAADLDAFVKCLSKGTITKVISGEICGPIVVPGAPLIFSPAALYIGKVAKVLRKSP